MGLLRASKFEANPHFFIEFIPLKYRNSLWRYRF